EQRRRLGRRAYCIHWPMWDAGDRAAFAPCAAYAAEATGSALMTVQQGLISLGAILHRDFGEVVVGLDRNNPRIRGELPGGPLAALELCAYLGRSQDAAQAALELRRGAKWPAGCRLIELDELPRREDGSIDRARLAAAGRATHGAARERVSPRSPTEVR